MSIRYRIALVFLTAFMGLGASKCSNTLVRPDISPLSAAEANDKTVIIEGCGSQPVSGYAYCRMREGAETVGSFTLIAPPTQCLDDKSCVSFQILFPDGSPSVGFQVPKGMVRQPVSWRELTKTAAFQKNQRGFWPVIMRWKWVSEADKREYESFAEGEIRLRVLAKDYLPLNEIHEDASFAWRWTEADKTIQYRMTTQGRSSTWKE